MMTLHYYKNYQNLKMQLRGDFKPSKVFLAEGDAEAFFMESLFAKQEFSENEYCIFCFKGLSNLRSALKFISDEENFNHVKSLGIMLDAENSPKGRYRSVISSLKSVQCAEDGIHFNENNIANYKGINIGLFISPGGNKRGNIETLTTREIETKEINTCITKFKNCLSEFGENINNKAITQIYISTKKPGLCGTHRGFETGILDVEHPVYEEVKNTILNL